jgi:hypothetical protein
VPFRPDLDLSEIITPYRPFIEGRRTPDHEDTISLDRARSIPLDERPITPRLSRVGYGPDTCSTNTDLVLLPEWSWDVNGYYRALGVHWKADRRALRLAYQKKNGPSSVFLTYVLRFLLDPVKRRAYDMAPLGSEFFDEWRDNEIKMRAKRKASKEAGLRGEEPTDEDAKRALKDLGYAIVEPDVGGVEEDVQQTFHSPWGYSYYVKDVACYDVDRLAQWQQMLVRAYADQGIRTTFSVGFIGGDQTYYTETEKDGRVTHYLGGTIKPTDELAQQTINTTNTHHETEAHQ